MFQGEGIQSYFSANAYAEPPNGFANHINNRAKLRTYDARLYNMVHSIFPCANFYIKRCNSRGKLLEICHTFLTFVSSISQRKLFIHIKFLTFKSYSYIRTFLFMRLEKYETKWHFINSKREGTQLFSFVQ